MGIFITYFSSNQLIFLLTGILLIIISIFFFLQQKYRISIFLLFLGAILIFLFGTILDPFLNVWDERFHALVAKNMLLHPFKLTLYDDLAVDMAYDRWDRFHIWLHKQPLFLWQIALSYKLFGVNEFSLRLPSAIMSSILIIFSYRVGKICINERVGYLSALLFSTSFYIIELVSGRQCMEHNDISFLFYVSASIWAWTEYLHSGKKIWILFIGVFSGFAILCKWLVGFLVYFAWGVFNLQKFQFNLYKYKDLLLSLIVSLIIALPWQIYIFIRFPEEALKEFIYNSWHFTKVIEGHRGDAWYHFDNISVLYGKIVPYLIIPALFLLFRNIKIKELKIAFILLPVSVYGFFSLAETKMISYPFVIALPVFISLACVIDFIINNVQKTSVNKYIKTGVIFLLLGYIGFINIDIEKLQEKHTIWKEDNLYTKRALENKKIFLEIQNSLPENTLLFNIPRRHYIEAMFYTDFPSYNFLPSKEQTEQLKNQGRTVAIFENNEVLPEYILNDSTLIVVHRKLYGYD